MRIGRPKNYADVVQLMSLYDKVHAFGVGHSWNKEQFCAGEDRNAINIELTKIDRRTILVNEKDMTVRVSGGTMLHSLTFFQMV